MRIVAYCRVSTDSDEQMESMENQKIFFNEFAKKNNFDLVRIYADEGISGKQMKNRTEFLKLLKDAELNLFDMVVVKDISRFARNTVDFLTAVRGLKSIGVDVKFLSNNQTILGDSEFILTIFSAMAQEESANLSKRVKFGKKINAQKGRVPPRIYGYDRIDNFTLVPNEIEAEVVKRIFYMYTVVGYGAGKISKILTDEKIPTKLGALGWTSKTIRRILTNSIYIGEYVNNKYEVKNYLTGERGTIPISQHIHHERPHFRIIDDETFKIAQEKIDSKRKIYKNEHVHMQGRDSTRHLFSTLIRCEHCGYSFSRKSYTYKNTRTYWVCTGFNVRGSNFCNNNVTLNESELLDFIKNFFAQLMENESEFISNLTNQFITKNEVNTNNIDINTIKKQISRYEREKEKYKNMYVNNIIDLDELKKRVVVLDDKINEQKDKLFQYNNLVNYDFTENHVKEIYNKIKSILELDNWTNMDLKYVLNKITVNRNGDVSIQLQE